MAGGPINGKVRPLTSNKIWCGPYVASDTSIQDSGIQVMASLDADATARITFEMPIDSLPTGTCKLRLIGLANAATGNAKVNPKWGSVAMSESAAAATRTAEGTTTISWAAGYADKYIETKITLDADTPVAGEMLCMDLVFETASWTLAVVSTWLVSVIWE